ncbi:MAG TPA: HAD family phosphatase [Natronosporangium sp.]|nr:HAD family phosphatase [Natronosporangium sp.]
MTGGTGLAAVLFDMDGTLIDSEHLWGRAMDELAAHHGGVLSAHARRAMLGRNAQDSLTVFYHDLGLTDPDPEGDDAFVTARMVDLFTTALTWRPGAAELVAEVRAAGLPTALVTSTRRRLVEVALASTLGADNFDVVVCGDEVSAPKPAPEPYQTAAAQLGVPIHRCVAIEDTPTGLASARAAGAVVLGVPSEVPLTGYEGVHVVSSLQHVDLPYLTRLVETASVR